MSFNYEGDEFPTSALNENSRSKQRVLHLLWDVCKAFGKPGECIYIVFKHRINEAMP